MRQTVITGIFIISFLVSGLVSSACTTIRIRETMREYNIIVKPGKTLRPRSYESGAGETQHLETEPTDGDTLMIIIRGRM